MNTYKTLFSRCLIAAGLCLVALTGAHAQTAFETPELAMKAAEDLVGTRDKERIDSVFGPGSTDLFDSGDAATDHDDFQRVKQMMQEKIVFEDIAADARVALLGNQGWPWPIPLVHGNDGWHFDTTAGREELLNRRIGRNELQTLSALHEIVDAQLEYRSQPRDGNPPAFATRFRSSPGKRDGLYWPQTGDDGISPLGDLLADSEVGKASDAPQPFNGYYYRMLDAQGPHAPGGAKSYVDANGRMTGGFAVIAWPAKHGNSGVMTFMIGRNGIAFQKDLGENTAAAAAAITRFDPDASWQPSADSMEAVDAEAEQPAAADAPRR